MIIWYGDTSFTCAKAWKMNHAVRMFDENDEEIMRIDNLYGEEWNAIRIVDGTWDYIEPPEPAPQPEPSEIEILQQKVEALKADLDFCLMLLEDV